MELLSEHSKGQFYSLGYCSHFTDAVISKGSSDSDTDSSSDDGAEPTSQDDADSSSDSGAEAGDEDDGPNVESDGGVHANSKDNDQHSRSDGGVDDNLNENASEKDTPDSPEDYDMPSPPLPLRGPAYEKSGMIATCSELMIPH